MWISGEERERERGVAPSGEISPSSRESAGWQEGEDSEEEMSIPEKDILCRVLPVSEELPYPLHSLAMSRGPATREYVFPAEKREEIFRRLYPFTPLLSLTDRVYDLHQGKTFLVGEYRVIRERERNILVSPFYPQTGGTVLDWLPDEKTCFHMVTLSEAFKE